MWIDPYRRALGYRLPRTGELPYKLFQWLGPKSGRSELFPGIHVDMDFTDATYLGTWWRGDRFEKPTADVFRHWWNHATTFFDIGSNYGFFSYLALSSQPNLQVHAFEPHPKTFARLKAVKEQNHLDRLSCWNQGMGEEEGVLPLQSGVGDLGHSTFGLHPGLAETKDVLKVPVQSFGAWRRNQGISIPPPGAWVAKVDVEGFELKVLEGMREELLAKSFRGLAVEMNAYTLEFCQTTPEAIYQFFDSVGYRAILPTEINPSFAGDSGNGFFVPKA